MSSSSLKSGDTPEPARQSKKGSRQENHLYFARSYTNGKSSEVQRRDGETSGQEK
jgi:hypothetical protein